MLGSRRFGLMVSRAALGTALLLLGPLGPPGAQAASASPAGPDGHLMNPRARQQILHKIQQIIHERVMFAPVIELAFLNGVGPRPAVHGLGLIANHAYSAPYEDLRLKRP